MKIGCSWGFVIDLKGHFQKEHYFAPNGGQPSILNVSQNVSVID